MWRSYLKALLAIAAGGLIFAGSGTALAQGSSGATLQASKTLEICDNGNGTWNYHGEVSVWNTGVNDAQGLDIFDCIEYKAPGAHTNFVSQGCLDDVNGATLTIPGLTQETNAITFTYSITLPNFDLTGTIRNNALLTIVNHSGNRVNGPNPKYTYAGGQPALCVVTQPPPGCTFTQGYWDNKPGVVWPASGPQRTDLFFNSGLTYQQIMDASVAGGNAYINLAHQYIAAVLNVANGAAEPATILSYITLSAGYFSAWPAGSSFCSSGGSSGCGLQVTWAGILADYNQGTGDYVGNPGHCPE